MRYRYNNSCSCPRCRAHGLMGPAVLITLGVLFLLDQIGHAHWMDFGFTWPAILIVIGVIKLLEHSASIEGHVPRDYPQVGWQPQDPRYGVPPYSGPPTPGAPGYQGPLAVVTPPPVPTAGFIAPGSPPKGPDERGGA